MMEQPMNESIVRGGGGGGGGSTAATTHPLRPTSLLGPEKEPVNFTVNLVGAPQEVEQLVEHIRSVAEQFLYHWKTFPIGKICIYSKG